MVLFAHGGHVAVTALYALPIAIVVTAIVISAVRSRRETLAGERPGDPESGQ